MDKYDRAVAYLTKRPHLIYNAWSHGFMENFHIRARVLFSAAGGFHGCGCLTQVKSGSPAHTPALERAIRADIRIPWNADEITVKSLPVFAEWQRRLDRYAFRKRKNK